MQDLRNLGPTSATWLATAGIHTLDELKQLGTVVAYARVREQQPRVSLNLLWALEGAVRDCDWREISAQDKQRLKRELEQLTE